MDIWCSRKPPAYAGTDFIVARNGRIVSVYSFSTIYLEAKCGTSMRSTVLLQNCGTSGVLFVTSLSPAVLGSVGTCLQNALSYTHIGSPRVGDSPRPSPLNREVEIR